MDKSYPVAHLKRKEKKRHLGVHKEFNFRCLFIFLQNRKWIAEAMYNKKKTMQ